MCYLVRQQQPEGERSGATLPPSLDRLKPRWIGAAAAALIAGLAVAAAMVVSPSSPPLSQAKVPAAPAPVASRTKTVPAAAFVEQNWAPGDDGVPTSSDVANAATQCHHDL